MKSLPNLNRCLLTTFLSGALAVCSGGLAKADPSLSTGTFTTDDVLSLAGTEVYGVAMDANDTTITTGNGYSFTGDYSGTAQTEITNADGGGTYANFISDSASDPSYSATTGDASFDSILESGIYNGGAITYTLNGLTAGVTYDVLVFMADDRPPQSTFNNFTLTDGPQTVGGPSFTGSSQNFRFADGTGVVATDIPEGDPATSDQVEGGYLLDTFTEALDSTSHVITVGTNIEVSGILVGTPVTTPEPSSMALLLVGAGAAVGLARYRMRQS